MKTKTSKRNRRNGAVAVEMAMCLPVLFIFLFGAYEIGRANMLLHSSESAAYEGARVGILPGATPEKIEAAVTTIMNSIGVQDFNVVVSPQNIQADTEKINVQVELPLRSNTTLTGFFLKDPIFRGECELTRETL